MSIQQSQLMALKNIGNAATRPQALYVPDTFVTKSVQAAGDTVVWTAGSNWMLLGFTLSASGTLAAQGELIMQLHDNTTPTPLIVAEYNTTLPATGSPANGGFFGGQDYGGGYGWESLPAVTELVLNLSAALTSGHVILNAWGTLNVFPAP